MARQPQTLRFRLLLVGLFAILAITAVSADFEMVCMAKCVAHSKCRKFGPIFAEPKCESRCKKKCYKVTRSPGARICDGQTIDRVLQTHFQTQAKG